ncbi:MAG TPA: GNAT family protein [Candidatus Binatus sp.]|nr:GNAT family protein [Candidatus Binatus sp.]
MEGKLVRLRAYERSDLDSIMKWINDEEVTDFLAGGMLTYPVSSITEEKFIEAAAHSSDTEKSFAIETLADRKYLGGVSFHAINWLNRSAGLGITIGDKSFWGKGYGTDAMRVMMRLGFDKMNLHRLWLHVYDYNQRAIASYEKCGFKHEGALREDRFYRGKYHDTIVMGILESEYRALP